MLLQTRCQRSIVIFVISTAICALFIIQASLKTHWSLIVTSNGTSGHSGEIKDNKGPSGTKSQLALVSYMRSGSTFASEIIKQSGNVFVSFEPFWAVYRNMYRTKNQVCFRNGSCRFPNGPNQSLNGTTDILYNLFTCKLSHLPAEVLATYWTFPQSSGHSHVNRCHTLKPRFIKTKILAHAFKDIKKKSKCIKILEKICKSSRTILIKTIRLSVEVLQHASRKIPDLKVIHLVRDPRAILHSRLSVGEITELQVKGHARGLCSRMNEDCEISKRDEVLEQHFLILRYECLTLDPKTTVKSLFNQTKLYYPESLNSWLTYYTNGNASSFDHKFGIKRGNSIDISSKWMNNLPKHVINYINEECHVLYNKKGLVSLQVDKNVNNTTQAYSSMCTLTSHLI